MGREDSSLKQTQDGCGSRKKAAEPKACLLRCQTLSWEGMQWTVCVCGRGGLVCWEGDP